MLSIVGVCVCVCVWGGGGGGGGGGGEWGGVIERISKGSLEDLFLALAAILFIQAEWFE